MWVLQAIAPWDLEVHDPAFYAALWPTSCS